MTRRTVGKEGGTVGEEGRCLDAVEVVQVVGEGKMVEKEEEEDWRRRNSSKRRENH